MMKWTLAAVILGFILDIMIGDPRWIYHPIRIIGNLIAFLERVLRSCFPASKVGERIAGTILMLLVTGISAVTPLALLYVGFSIHTALGVVLEVIMCYQLLAAKALKDESMKVYRALLSGDLLQSRYAVSMIVGRDTQELDEAGVTRAAVETVAENASDGVIAPLFYLLLGGPVLGFAYKAINTMDSMVGYKNERYRYFGSCVAHLDDVVNFIPSRLAGLLMTGAAFLGGFDGKNAWRIFCRDRKNHASPNSAQTEAVMAGALQVQLAGDACYFGKIYHKPTIGDPIRPIEAEDIIRANRLMYRTAIFAVLLLGSLRMLIMWAVAC